MAKLAYLFLADERSNRKYEVHKCNKLAWSSAGSLKMPQNPYYAN